jgi:DTW domain-containing protein YfiP
MSTPYPAYTPLFPANEPLSLTIMILLATAIVLIVVAGAWAALRRLRRMQTYLENNTQKET